MYPLLENSNKWGEFNLFWHIFKHLLKVEMLKPDALLVKICISVELFKNFSNVCIQHKAYYASHFYPLLSKLMYIFREI